MVQNAEFTQRERKLLPAAPRRVRGFVHSKIARGQALPPAHARAPQQRLHVPFELAQFHGFCQIIVDADIVALFLGADVVQRRQKNDGQVRVEHPQQPRHLKAVRLRQHHIRYHDIVALSFHQPKGFLRAQSAVRRKSLFGKEKADGFVQRLIVFDQ